MPADTALAKRAERGFRFLGCLLAVGLIAVFALVALRRLRYPFELDRMESAMMTSIWRLAHGKPLYGPPTLEWAAFLYAPLFFHISAAVAKLTGLSYVAPRLVSIVSTLGSFAVIYALVLRETRRHAAALVAAGLYAAMYPVVLGWFDVGRVDSLSVFFFLAALYSTRWTNPILAAVLWLLAFQTKQSILPIALLAFLPEWRRPGRMVLGMGSVAVFAAASVVLCNRLSGGWYSFYVFGVASRLALQPRQAATYIPVDLLEPLGIAIALIIVAVLLAPPAWRSTKASFYAIVTLLIVGGVGFVRAHEGANVNALMPVYAWLAVLFGLAVHRLLAWSEQLANPLPAAVVWLFVVVQLASHLYLPGRYKVSSETLAYRTQFLDALRTTPGDVWAVNHSFDGILAGKPTHAEMDALDAVLGRGYAPVVNELQQDYASGHFAAVVLDRDAESYTPEWVFNGPLFRAHYSLMVRAPGSEQPSLADQPVIVYLPCDAPVSGLNSPTAWFNRGNCLALPSSNPGR